MIEHCLPGRGGSSANGCCGSSCGCARSAIPALQDVAHDLYARLHDWFAGVIAEGVERGRVHGRRRRRTTDVLLARDRRRRRARARGRPGADLDRARALLLGLASREVGATVA